MDSVGAGSGGGIHPGAPVIWPTSKQVKQVSEAQQAQQSGQATTVAAQAAKETSVTQQIAQQAQQAQQAGSPTVARALSKTDISAQLVQIGLPVTNDNIQIANKMLQHGLELSSDNFSSLFEIMKGSGGQQSTLEAAMIAISKGLNGQPAVLKPLENYLSNDPQIAKQMQSMQASLTAFKSALLGGRNLLAPQLMGQLSSLVATLDSQYKKYLEGPLDKEDLMAKLLGGDDINDLTALRALMLGMAKKLANMPNEAMAKDAKQLAKAFIALGKQADEMLQNITAQAVLSKNSSRQDTAMPDKYNIWQVPNTLTQLPTTMEILIKKDESKQNSQINESKTRIIIKLETDDLGEISIIIDVEERNIWYIFNTENDKTREFMAANTPILRDRMNQLDWNVKGVQAIKRKLDTKKYLVPTINLDSLKRISTEA